MSTSFQFDNDIFKQKNFTFMCFGRKSCDHVKDMLTSYSIFVVQEKPTIPYIPEPVFVVIYRQENNGCLRLNIIHIHVPVTPYQEITFILIYMGMEYL